jgi:hypothetical protein
MIFSKTVIINTYNTIKNGITKSSTVVQVRERESTNTVVIQGGFRPTIDRNLQGIQEKEAGFSINY